VGAAIEGPSAEGFYLYPTYGLDQEGVRADGGRGTPTPPFIYPDGQSRHWSLDYHPDTNGGTGSITVTLNGQAVTLDLDPGHKQIGAQFNRFGIITTHIDGSGQTVYFDDLTYTIGTLPILTIAKSAPAEVQLQWPTSYTGFTLESALTLDAGSRLRQHDQRRRVFPSAQAVIRSGWESPELETHFAGFAPSTTGGESMPVPAAEQENVARRPGEQGTAGGEGLHEGLSIVPLKIERSPSDSDNAVRVVITRIAVI
jgi:hypothetical protein